MILEHWRRDQRSTIQEEQWLNNMRTYIDTIGNRRFLSSYPETFINQLNHSYPDLLWRELDYAVTEGAKHRHEELQFTVLFEQTQLWFVFRNNTVDYTKTSYFGVEEGKKDMLSTSQQMFIAHVYQLANEFLQEHGFNRLELLTAHFEEVIQEDYDKILQTKR